MQNSQEFGPATPSLIFTPIANEEEHKLLREQEEIKELEIEHTYKSNHFRERRDKDGNPEEVQILTLHYSALPEEATLGVLTNNPELAAINADYFINTGTDLAALCSREVSVHHVISESGKAYQLVDTEKAAYAAGVSYWNGHTNINNISTSIMNVSQGFKWLNQFPEDRAVTVPGSDKTWFSFTEAQIEATIALCHSLIQQFGIKPYNIIGNGDAACTRHVSPGPLFPWKRLAEAGIGLWYDRTESSINEDNMPANRVLWMQNKLSEFGYNRADDLGSVMKAFQMHFRQDNIDGNIDLECMQIIDSLCQRKLSCELQEENRRAHRPTT